MGYIYLSQKLMQLKNPAQIILNTKYVCSGMVLFFTGLILVGTGYLIRNMEWGKYQWAMTVGVMLLGGSFVLFLWSLIRKMDYQSLKEQRFRKTKKETDSKIN